MIPLVWMGALYENGERIDNPPLTDGDGWEVGWAFYWGYQLSNHYKQNVASIRPAITVCLPQRNSKGWKTPDGVHPVPFCIDSFPSSDVNGNWDVEVDLDTLVKGQQPIITVSPSIDCRDLYHGYVQNGFITEDLGG